MSEQKNNFAKLSLSATMLGNLEQLGYLQMTAIQAASLPVTLAGKDLIAQANWQWQDRRVWHSLG